MRGLKHEGLYIAPHFLDPSSLQSLIFSCEGSYGPALLFLKPLIFKTPHSTITPPSLTSSLGVDLW